ncbi:hypothetical protein [Candidatus Poriferisodalis sp.]|uniref:hypothetical protein n=1 Tax=Candidatus Poriferisodalis sp. TaxID=3101277 RepID=UPI003B027747
MDWASVPPLLTIFLAVVVTVAGGSWAIIKFGFQRAIELLNARFDTGDQLRDAQGARFDARFDAVDARIDARFDIVDSRFDTVDSRFDAVDSRFDIVDSRFEAVDSRFEAVDSRFDKVDVKIDAVDKRVDAVDRRIDELRVDLRAVVNRIEAFQAAIVPAAIGPA